MKLSIVHLFAAGMLLLAGCSTVHHATKWEYREVMSITEVNQLADQGWSVVNFTSASPGPTQYLLKRAKP